MITRPFLLLVTLAYAPACATQTAVPVPAEGLPAVDSARVIDDLRYLSSLELGGRETGSPGNQLARDYVADAFRDAGLEPLNGPDWIHPFQVPRPSAESTIQGANVLGLIRGTRRPDRYIVVSAHFDHLGTRGGSIFPGADDNASGTAALLEIGRRLTSDPPENSVILAAFDAEELGLQGARAFISAPPVPIERIVLNVNMDMIGRNDGRELYVAGTYHYPFLEPVIDVVARESPIRIRKGHDRPNRESGDDWTMLSDHGAFHAAGVPFLYFGVEDHEDYHRPTDAFEGIQPAFYVDAVSFVLAILRRADERLDRIEAEANR